MSTAPRPLVPEDNGRYGDAVWKRSFVRAAAATVLAQLRNDISPDEILARNWPADRDAVAVLRAPSTPTMVGAIPGSTIIKLLLLAPRSVASQLLPLGLTVDLRGVDTLSIPSVASFSDAAFIGEGLPIPVRQGQFTGHAAGPLRKIGLLAALSRELSEASAAETIIDFTLRVSIGRGIDKILLSNSAADTVTPAGLLAGTAGLTPTAGGGFPALNTDLRAIIGAIARAGIDTESIVFVCAPEQATTLRMLMPPGAFAPVASAPVAASYRVLGSNVLPAGTVLAVATAGLLSAGDGGNPVVDLSKQSTLSFTDPGLPIGVVATPPVVGAPAQSLFQDDTIALRCTSLLNWSAAAGSVSWVSNCTW